MDGIVELADDFDQIALVVDWLDACRNRDLTTLLDLYADDATLECRCGEAKVSEGRAELESYWRPRLDALAPTAFGLEEITPTAEGVVLDYLSHEGKPVRIAFTFSRDAKIQRTACAPVAQALRQEAAARRLAVYRLVLRLAHVRRNLPLEAGSERRCDRLRATIRASRSARARAPAFPSIPGRTSGPPESRCRRRRFPRSPRGR